MCKVTVDFSPIKTLNLISIFQRWSIFHQDLDAESEILGFRPHLDADPSDEYFPPPRICFREDSSIVPILTNPLFNENQTRENKLGLILAHPINGPEGGPAQPKSRCIASGLQFFLGLTTYHSFHFRRSILLSSTHRFGEELQGWRFDESVRQGGGWKSGKPRWHMRSGIS